MADKTEEEQKLLDLLKLKRSLEKAELKDTEQYITTVKQIEILQKKVKEHQKGILKYFGDTNKAAAALKSSMMEMGNSMKQIGQIWVATDFTNIGMTLLKQNVEIEKSLHRTLINSGKFGPSLKEAKDNVLALRTQFGATYQEAAETIKTLSEKQYVGNLKEAADSSFLFARATGMGKEEVAQLTVALQKEGKISGKATTAMYADLLKIQQSNGMTKEGMKATTDQIVKMSAQMRAFGKSEGEIRQMATATGRLVSSFEKVGISAQEATQWINKMLDPERIEENIASYAALGVSMTDALTGNIDQGQLETGLKEFGEKVKAMGPIAGKAYAQAMGISYSMAIKASDAEKVTEEALTPEESAAKSLESLAEATQSFHEKVEEFVNKIEGTLQGLPNILLAGLAILGPQIAKIFINAFKSAFDRIEEDTSAVSSRIAKQFEKGSLKARDVMKISADELYSYLDGTTNKAAEDMMIAIDKVFSEMSKKPKGIKWFEDQQKSIDSVIKSLEKEAADIGKQKNDLIAAEKRIEQLTKKKKKITDNERKELIELKAKREALNKAVGEGCLREEKIRAELERQSKIRDELKNKMQAARPSSALATASQKPTVRERIGNAASSAKGAVKKGFGKAKNVAGSIGGAIGKITKVLGPIAIAIGVISKILQKSQKFQEFMKKINEKVIEPFMKEVAKIFEMIDFDTITDVLCKLLPPVLWILKMILWPAFQIMNFVMKIINAIASWFGKGVDENVEDIKENTENREEVTNIRVDAGGSTRTYVGDNSSSSESSETTASKPKTSSDTSVKETSSSSASKEEKEAEIRNANNNRVSSEISETLKSMTEMISAIKSYLQGDGSGSVANSIKIGIDGATIKLDGGGEIKPESINGYLGQGT